VQRNRRRISNRYLLNTWQVCAAANQLVHERRFLSGGRVLRAAWSLWLGGSRADRHQPLRIESESDIQQVPEAVKEKASRNHQHQRQCKFGNYQNAPRSSSFARGG